MQLTKKKELAAKVLGVGKSRILFVDSHLPEIKEAITRQDIRDLASLGAIKIKEVSGRKKVVKRKHRRRTGKVKKKVNKSKKEYVIITRKLRTFVRHLLKTGAVDKEKHREVRKMIRARRFKSKRHLKESLKDL
ncbi:MAG: 50S ribosomal protein L19e [archaeon]|nr:50S ribosomal protein L19e [archaeon]MCR4323959.1 50S ribosomal protein L19e [Nanoarchaeota archaeon]